MVERIEFKKIRQGGSEKKRTNMHSWIPHRVLISAKK